MYFTFAVFKHNTSINPYNGLAICIENASLKVIIL